ncbi:DJ-1 family glyoxalase III [Peptococcus simiae]|uniref:DJ-1 family glyoxalase III n=1 Tax=Peptococcus simiae TaxID=1643805 RepID=UPI0039807587
MDKRVCVLLAPGYEEVEALTPVDYLRRAGLVVDVVSTTEDIAVESSHKVIVQADTFLDDIQAKDYALVVIPGGLPGAPNLAANPKVIDLLQAVYAQGDYVAALCAGPIVLEKAGLLKGRACTCFPGVEDKLESKGTFKTDTVVRDDRVITSRGAGAAGYFSLALIEALVGPEKAAEVKKAVVMDIVEDNLRG